MSGTVDTSPAESVNFEKVYEAIFDHHDIHMTGQVKTMNLVQSVKDDMKQSNFTERQLKHHIEDLTRRLDPQNDDGYVSKETFVKQGVDWMRSVTEKTNNNSVSSTSLASIASQPELEEISILSGNHTYGSIELVNGASFSAEKLNLIDLQEEIAEYRKQIKLMNDEKTQMINQLNQAEDTCDMLTQKNKDNESRIQQLKISLDKALQYQQELEQLKDSKIQNETVKSLRESSSQRRLSQLANENVELQNQLDETRDHVNSLIIDLDNAKKNHSLTVEKLQEENKKTEEQLNETMMIRMKLEQHIQDLEDNFTDRDSHSFQKVPPMFERGSELFRNSFDEYNDPFAVNQNHDEPGAGPVSMSTPHFKKHAKNGIVRSSIGDEIKGAVNGVARSLPLCEKSVLFSESTKIIEGRDIDTQTTIVDIWNSVKKYYDWKRIALCFMVIAMMLIFGGLFLFTFFGSIEFEDGRRLMPILWSPRFFEPFTFIKIEQVPPAVW